MSVKVAMFTPMRTMWEARVEGTMNIRRIFAISMVALVVPMHASSAAPAKAPCNATQQSFIRSTKGEVVSAQAALAYSQKNLSHARAVSNSAQLTQASVQAQITSVKTTIATLQDELLQATAVRNNQQITRIMNAIRATQKGLPGLQKRLDRATAAAQAAQDNTTQAQADVTMKIAAVADANTRLARLTAACGT